MPVIIDGNNLLHTLPDRQRSRKDVRRLALEAVRHEMMQLVVVFDGPAPSGCPEVEVLGSVTVRYSGSASADETILRLLPGGKAQGWVVVTDDRDLGRRARELGASVRPLSHWRRRKPPRQRRVSTEPKLSSREVEDWETYFSVDDGDESGP
ncbi:MAG: NYN domain-containing protein [Acidobacteriota bacterium]|jgi:hypothetical protein